MTRKKRTSCPKGSNTDSREYIEALGDIEGFTNGKVLARRQGGHIIKKGG
jgi:hypothetical protein